MVSILGRTPTEDCHACPCDLCGSSDHEPLPYAYHFKGEDLLLVQCRGCGLRFLQPRLSEATLLSLYSREYFDKDYVCGLWEGDYISNKANLLQEAHAILELVSTHAATGGSLLDVGCAGGYLLTAAREKGFDAWGVEINPEMVQFARGQGHRVHLGVLESANFPNDCFDVVLMCDVFEHVASPRHLLMEVRRITKPGGYLYIRGPIGATLAQAIFRNFRRLGRREVRILPGYPYHVTEFTPRTLDSYLRSTGFQTTYVTTAETFLPTRTTASNLSVKTVCELLIRSLSKCASLLPFTGMGDFIEILACKLGSREDAPSSPGDGRGPDEEPRRTETRLENVP